MISCIRINHFVLGNFQDTPAILREILNIINIISKKSIKYRGDFVIQKEFLTASHSSKIKMTRFIQFNSEQFD